MNLGRRMYLELLKRTLTGMVYEDPSIPVAWKPDSIYDASRRLSGRDWPLHAHTMIGLSRMDNLQECIEQVIDEDIPGDFIETGVWRGGACIFMRGMLKVYGIKDRIVWAADTFCGFPASQSRPDDSKLASQPDQDNMIVSLNRVEQNFRLYGLLDDQVKFLQGPFSETLPGQVRQLAILRLDGDLYSSTTDALTALYPKLQPGGFCIVDDWNVSMCRLAVNTYREDHKVTEIVHDIDGHSIYWRKENK